MITRTHLSSLCAGIGLSLLTAGTACSGSDPQGSGGGGTRTTSAAGGGGTGGTDQGGTSTTGTGGDSTGGTGTGGSTTGSGGSVAASCGDLPLCDDFEGAAPGGPPDAATWAVVSPNCSGTGAVVVDGGVARSGAHSLRVDGKGGYCNHVFIGNTAVVPAIGDVLYGRLFVRFADALGQGHTTFLAMKDAADGGKDLRMGGQNGVLMYNRESDDATLPAMSPVGTGMSVAPAPSAWTCIEFRIDGAQGTIDTWVDGAEVTGLVEDGASTPDVDQQWINQKPGWKPDLQDLRIGWESYAGQDMTLWFDDVALGNDRIGCD